MRVEDLDRGRVRQEFVGAQLADLAWLGLDWDEGPDIGGAFGPYLQSQRTERYDAALQMLWNAGLLYPCHCSRKEIAAAATAPHGPDDDGPPYPGICRDRYDAATSLGDFPGAALRFRVPPVAVEFEDELQGRRREVPAEGCGDFVVRRKDGVAAYQLAVVVDDAAMRISHVLRGADLIGSTARQILLYRALGFPEPRWVHVPLMLGEDGERFSKRSGALSLRQLREAGHSPGGLVGWLASTCGLASRNESLTPADLLARWDLDLLPRPDTRVSLPDWLRT